MKFGKQRLMTVSSERRRWLWLAVIVATVLFWAGGQGIADAADTPRGHVQQQPPGTIPEPTPEPTFAPKPTSRPDGDSGSSRPTATPLPSGGQPAPDTGASTVLTGTINVPVLNVRQGPGTTYPIIGRVGRDTVVTILGRNRAATWLNFCCVPNTETRGWISAQFVTPSYTQEQAATIPVVDAVPPAATSTATPTARPVDPGARTGVVSAVALNMREAPSTDAAILGKVRSGAIVTVLARNTAGDWWLVCCVPATNENGWVAAEFVTPNFTDAASLPVTTGRDAPPAPTKVPATATPTPTPAPLAETTLELAVAQEPAAALQGEQIVLAFTVTNTGTAAAAMVELSFELPAGLSFVSASADGGDVAEESATGGAAIVVVTWESVPAGESASAKVTAIIAESMADGTVIDGAAAAVAENAGLASTPVSVGLPPLLPPDFQ